MDDGGKHSAFLHSDPVVIQPRHNVVESVKRRG